jgi:hypothetical protein
MRMIVLASFIALVGCDHPMFHQDRPGGTDYVPYGYTQPYRTAPASYGQIAQARRDCDYGNRAACDWIRQGNW